MLSRHAIDHYLHTILVLSERFLVVRAIDVAAWLGHSKPSVSVAVKQMAQEGMIRLGSNNALILSEDGRRRAAAFQARYDFFYRLLTDASIHEDIAKKEAAALACSLSDSSLEALNHSCAEKLSGKD